jgi:hypothetical protein
MFDEPSIDTKANGDDKYISKMTSSLTRELFEVFYASKLDAFRTTSTA